MELDASLAFLALSIGKLSLLPGDGDRLELVRMSRKVRILDTVLALIKICADRAVKTIPL